MIKVILWDIDGTILDFKASEKHALRTCFSLFHLGDCTDAMVARYSEINRQYWNRLERGELPKAQILVERFETFFRQENILCEDADAFNQAYQIQLSETICFLDDAYHILQDLSAYVKQYAVTNGTYAAQKRKLEASGLEKIFDASFISDEIGAEKPSIEFFSHVFRQIGPYPKQEILIIGDSLTSDIQGGNNAGIRCCWYNPQHHKNNTHLRIDHIIWNLNQVKDIILKS